MLTGLLATTKKLVDAAFRFVGIHPALLVTAGPSSGAPAKLWDAATEAKGKPAEFVAPGAANGALACSGYYDLCLNITVAGTNPSLFIDIYVWSSSQAKYMLRKSVIVTADAGIDPIDIGVADYVYIGTSSLTNVTGYTISGAMRA